MEFQSTIENTIDEIVRLLAFVEEDYWKQYLIYEKNRLLNEETPREMVSRDILKIFKEGMGSFSDLVLHKNSVPLIDETNQLESLKDRLFHLCKTEI